jgi:pilus assembly protein FimV
MKSAVRRVLLLSALMSPNALLALGLGEIHLNSALNQPFDADIDLVSAADEDLSALRASLASGDTFARYGLDKPAFLADFTFRVVRGANGQDVLKVTSPRPVTEPFVTLLVEANWPRGRLLREYTVLLDPPVFAPAPQAAAAPVAAPRVAAPAPAPAAPASSGTPEAFASAAAAPKSTPSAPPPSRPAAAPVAAPSISAGSSYRVRPNDTLWKIASAAHPGKRSDVNRAMVAIYQSNPQAFDGNINVLRSGSLLKIPSASDVSAISASAAAAEVARQYRMWREGVPATEGPDATGGRLRLVTPEQGTTAASTSTSPPAAAATGAGSPELQSKVQQLEAELAEAKRLLEVRNAELATLQGQAAPAPGVAPAPEAAPAAGAPAVAPEAAVPPPAAEGAPVAEAPAVPAEAAPAAAAQPEPAKPKKTAKKTPAAEPEPSLLGRLGDYWWALLGLLAAALAWLFYKRSRAETGTSEQDLQEALARTTTDLRARAAVQRSRESDIVVEERRPAEPAQAPKAAPAAAPRAPEPSRKPVAIDDTLSGEGPVSIESGDPLAEADFHMAYGLYDQAADLVQLAIKREPVRRDLKLKLLEIFFVWGNRDRFLELAREMRESHRDAQPGEWDKILIMGKQLAPDDPVFAGATRSTAADLDMELHSSEGPLDMDLGADFGTSTGTDIDLTAAQSLAPGEAGLDFVIDEPVRGADEGSALAPTVETPRLKSKPASEEPTQEVPIEELGIDVGELEELGDLEGSVTLEVSRPKAVIEDTVETPRPSRTAEEEGEDLLSSTGILKEQTGILRALGEGQELDIDLSDATGELPTVEATRLPGSAGGVDFAIGEEAATMSEVGTKLDLARAYIDMGDPEGARSILDEVLKEGSAAQKQEAERLVASLP